jgi:hypothetical protein
LELKVELGQNMAQSKNSNLVDAVMEKMDMAQEASIK